MNYEFEIVASTEGIDYIRATAHITNYEVDEYKSESLTYTLSDIILTRCDDSVIYVDREDMEMLINDQDKEALEVETYRAARWGLGEDGDE